MSFKEHIALSINSKFRDRGTTNNFEIQLNDNIHFNHKEDKQYYTRIEDVHIPVSFDNINDNNNTFIVNEFDGVSNDLISITVENGNYSIVELLQELQTQLNANTQQTNTYTLSFSDITGRSSLTFTGGSTVITIKSPDNGSIMNDVLGFYIDGTEDTVNDSVVYNSPNKSNAQWVNEIKIITNLTSSNYYTHNGKENIGIRLNIDESRGEYIKVDNHDGFRTILNSKKGLRYLKVQLYDGRDNLLDLNGREFKFNLVIYEYNKL